jgi:predicted RNase H-like HicB family nuclease
MSVKKIKAIEPPYKFEEYMHEITPLSKEDGGGFLITFPDLPGCMADGETI